MQAMLHAFSGVRYPHATDIGVIGIMHTFLATAYLIGESSILHFAAGSQK